MGVYVAISGNERGRRGCYGNGCLLGGGEVLIQVERWEV